MLRLLSKHYFSLIFLLLFLFELNAEEIEDFRGYEDDNGDIFIEDDSPDQPPDYPKERDWFRVRRQEQPVENLYPEHRDLDLTSSVRNRRVYAPPVYTTDPRYQQPLDEGGTSNQCKCDLEYVLKYRGTSNPHGAYHVKIYHEETGQFKDAGSHSDDHFRDGYTYSGHHHQHHRPSQKERPRVEYYVEEVDDPGDRRDIYTRGGGSKATTSNTERGSSSRVVDNEERYLYKSRTPRNKPNLKIRKLAKIARVIVYRSKWAMVSIVSSQESPFLGYPYSQTFRVSDGTARNSTGVPYIYLTPGVLEAAELGDMEIAKASLIMTQQEDNSLCEEDDPGSWDCARVTLSGRILPVTSSKEIEHAAESLSARHSHQKLESDGFFGRLVIKNVVLEQNGKSGGLWKIPVNDYLHLSI